MDAYGVAAVGLSLAAALWALGYLARGLEGPIREYRRFTVAVGRLARDAAGHAGELP